MAFDGKVNPEATKKLNKQLRQQDQKDRKRRIRNRRAIREAADFDDMPEYYPDEEQEQETYLDRWKQRPFSWF